MTAYQNFVQDFPQRCQKMLDDYSTRAARQDLDVTLLLTVATSALVVPCERL